jgi:hypothetical protein
VISYDYDHIYISDDFATGYVRPDTGEYLSYKGEADTLIRKQ